MRARAFVRAYDCAHVYASVCSRVCACVPHLVKYVVTIHHGVTVLAGEVFGSGALHQHSKLPFTLFHSLQALLGRVHPGILLADFVPQVLQRGVSALPQRILRGTERQSSYGNIVRLYEILISPENYKVSSHLSQ